MDQKNLLICRTDLTDTEVMKICDLVRETGYALHSYLGPGFREKVYEAGLAHRLSKLGLKFQCQPRVMVHDEDGTPLSQDQLDLVVEKVLIVELKAVREILDSHTAQLLGYLKATDFRHGLLLNFGGPRFQIKKYVF